MDQMLIYNILIAFSYKVFYSETGVENYNVGNYNPNGSRVTVHPTSV